MTSPSRHPPVPQNELVQAAGWFYGSLVAGWDSPAGIAAHSISKTMHAGNYHRILVALDRALEVFAESAGELSPNDYQLKRDIELVRSKILKAETGTPFAPKVPPAEMPGAAPDPQLTKAPWGT